MLPSESSNFCRNHFHFEVSIEVSVPDVHQVVLKMSLRTLFINVERFTILRVILAQGPY